MKQVNILLFILVLNSLLENAKMLHNTNNSFKAYKLETNIDNPKILLPKYGKEFFKPIRINYVLVTNQILNNYKTGISNEIFILFKKLVIDPVDSFFKKTIKVFPLSNFPQNLNFSRLNPNKTSFDFNVGKFVQGYVKIYVI